MNRPMRTVLLAMVAITVIASIPVHRASSHLNDFTDSGQVVRWPQDHQVLWNLNPSHGGNISGNRSLADVIQAAFNTWSGAPNTLLNVARGADSSKTSNGMDDTNLICFICKGDFTSEAETLAVTFTTNATQAGVTDGRGGTTEFAGQILDADILFNPNHDFTTDAGGPAEDLQTVATHEIGHFFGLSHSAVVRAIMYPFAPPVETTLSYDDVAGISADYPKASPDVLIGAISGTIRLNGAPVFGAHVYADSNTSAEPFAGFNVRKTPIGALSLPDGSYNISGVPADTYTVTAEPLDLPVTDSDVNGYASSFGKPAVQTNFTTRSH